MTDNNNLLNKEVDILKINIKQAKISIFHPKTIKLRSHRTL